MTQMCTDFKIETDLAQNLIDDCFSNFECQRNLSEKKKHRDTGLISEFLKTEFL